MLPDLLQEINQNRLTALQEAGVPVKPPLVGVVAGHGAHRGGEPAVLLFNAGESRPSFRLKLAHAPAGEARLMHEYRALQDMQAVAALQESTPRPVEIFRFEGSLVLIVTFLPGASLKTLFHRSQRARIEQLRRGLFLVQVWIQLLQTSTAIGAVQFPSGSAVAQRLTRLQQAGWDVSSLSRAFVERLMNDAHAHRELRVPLAGRHGDLQLNHVMLDGHRVHVIEWGRFVRGATPFDDVFQVALDLSQLDGSLYPERQASVQSFCTGFLERSWQANLIAEYVSHYLQAMHLPEQAAHLFFSLFLMDMCLADTANGDRQAGRASGRWHILATYAEHEQHSVFCR